MPGLHCGLAEPRLPIVQTSSPLHGAVLVGRVIVSKLHKEVRLQRREAKTIRLQEMHVQVQVQLCGLEVQSSFAVGFLIE